MTLSANVSSLQPSLDGQSPGHGNHVDAVVDGTQASQVVIPGGNFLLTAEFERIGSDLMLTGAKGHQVLVAGYFSNQSPDLVSESGGVIPSDLAHKLAGPIMHGAVAQASGGGGLTQIGVVDKVDGGVTVKHSDGSTENLVKGGTVYQGDVLETHDGNVGIIFADKTTFALGPQGRMVMDEMVYDPKNHTGHSTFSVVQGTFSFVSGQIAKSGPDNMSVKTPVMTIGIRGTPWSARRRPRVLKIRFRCSPIPAAASARSSSRTDRARRFCRSPVKPPTCLRSSRRPRHPSWCPRHSWARPIRASSPIARPSPPPNRPFRAVPRAAMARVATRAVKAAPRARAEPKAVTRAAPKATTRWDPGRHPERAAARAAAPAPASSSSAAGRGVTPAGSLATASRFAAAADDFQQQILQQHTPTNL